MIKVVKFASEVNPALSPAEGLLAEALACLARAATCLDRLQQSPGTCEAAQRLASEWRLWFHAATVWRTYGDISSEVQTPVRQAAARKCRRSGVRV